MVYSIGIPQIRIACILWLKNSPYYNHTQIIFHNPSKSFLTSENSKNDHKHVFCIKTVITRNEGVIWFHPTFEPTKSVMTFIVLFVYLTQKTDVFPKNIQFRKKLQLSHLWVMFLCWQKSIAHFYVVFVITCCPFFVHCYLHVAAECFGYCSYGTLYTMN